MRISLERLIFMRRPVGEFLEHAWRAGVDGVEFAEFELQRLIQEGRYDHSSLYKDVNNKGLTISGIYWSAEFHKSEERSKILSQAAGLAEVYGKIECRNVVIGPPRGGLGAGLPPSQVYRLLDQLVETLREALKIFVDNGITPSLHNHYDTLIETEAELEYVLSRIEPELLKFCPDTAHLALAGMDPVQMIRRHLDRIVYAHLKDLKSFQAEGKRVERWYELTTELGSGVIDFPMIVRLLRSTGRVEWLVVEQDFTEKTPEESVRMSLNYLAPLVRGD